MEIKDNMKTTYSKEEFDRFFPRGIKRSKENIRRYLANYILNKGYPIEETYQLVLNQLP